MQPITSEAIICVTTYMPDFSLSVQESLERKGAILLVLDNFEGDAELLYNCLWYAASHGVLVSVAPRILLSFYPTPENCAG